jgi:hypothetical protein
MVAFGGRDPSGEKLERSGLGFKQSSPTAAELTQAHCAPTSLQTHPDLILRNGGLRKYLSLLVAGELTQARGTPTSLQTYFDLILGNGELRTYFSQDRFCLERDIYHCAGVDIYKLDIECSLFTRGSGYCIEIRKSESGERVGRY